MLDCPVKKSCSDTKTCESQFKDKNCKCVTTNSKSKSGCNSLKTICAYEENGTLYGCSVGCCQNQCDEGQCPGSKLKFLTEFLPEEGKRMNWWFILFIVLLVVLLLTSTIAILVT